ncbi:hypothetical protein [Pilimelia columellifera]|uniref:Uncharacterized protein n=1 Tax=Pilimelia columellifera subsp. columellifera TaxID=706583 RepID=A0ABN3NFI6_9ACTN
MTTDPATDEPGEGTPPARRTGWRRLLPPWSPGVLVLVLALFAVGLLLFPNLRQPATTEPQPLAAAWPKAVVGSVPAAMPDGPAYDPLYVLTPTVSAGTAPTPDGAASRLVVWDTASVPRVLKTLPLADDPLFAGVTASGDTLLWAETISGGGGSAISELWSADWRRDVPPRRLTTATGALAFFNSQHDLTVAENRVHWVALGAGETPVTEIRSTPLTGGAVAIQKLAGQWALSAWPWLVSAVSASTGEAQLHNLVENRQIRVPSSASELVTCSPAWCRVQVVGADGPTQLDLMRVDGSQRRRVAGPGATAAITDVAVLDRYEVLTRVGGQGAVDSQQDLLLYDAAGRRTVEVARGVGMVNSRGGWLWWSTGQDDTTAWRLLDLRSLR